LAILEPFKKTQNHVNIKLGLAQ